MRRISVYIVKDQGRVIILPFGSEASRWLDLVNRTEFTPEQIKILRGLGVDIEIITESGFRFNYRE